MLGCKNLAAIGLPPHVVIFVKYREVSTRTMLLNFIDLSAETALYSRFGGHKGGVVKEEKGEGEEAHVFSVILLANQSDSPWQPKRSLRIATAVRYSYYKGGTRTGQTPTLSLSVRNRGILPSNILEHLNKAFIYCQSYKSFIQW